MLMAPVVSTSMMGMRPASLIRVSSFLQVPYRCPFISRYSTKSLLCIFYQNEKSKKTYLLKFFLANQLIVVSWLYDFFGRSCRIADFLLEDSLVLLEDGLDQSVLADTWWPHKNEWLSSEGSRVERMEVLLCVNEYIILKLQISKSSELLTGLWRSTLLKKSLRTSRISGWLITYSSCDSINSSFRTERYWRTSLSKFTLDKSSD